MPVADFNNCRDLRRARIRRRPGFTLVEMVLVVGTIAVLISLLLPALTVARESARKTQCRNNLMQIGIAVFNYEMAAGVYPPGTINLPGPIFNVPEGFHMNWAVQVLSVSEQFSLFNQIDTRYGVYDASNATLGGSRMAMLECPLNLNDSVGGVYRSSFAACTGGSDVPITATNDGLFFLNSSVSPTQVHDGLTNTIMVGERRRDSVPNGIELGWPSGTASTLRNTGIPINSESGTVSFGEDGDGTGGFGSGHAGGALFLFADGSVTFLNEDVDAETFSRLGTRDGGVGTEGVKYRVDDGF